MELRDYMGVLRRHLALIAAAVLICIAAASFLTIRATPQYVSTTQLFVTAAGAVEDDSAFQGSQFALQRVKSYANLNRLIVANRVVDRLDLDQSAQSLTKQVTVFAVPDTVLLGVSAKADTSREAQQLSQAFAQELVKYVVELESTAERGATVSLSIVGSASTPGSQDSPLPVRNLLIAAALGLVLGAAAATLRENLDPRIRSTADLEKALDPPCLGTVTYDTAANRHPLLLGLDPYAPRVEAFRVVRTNLQFLSTDASRSVVYLVTGAVPGQGKAIVAANVAESLAEAGRSVVLLEADMRQPTMGAHFSLETDRGLSTLLDGRTPLDDAIQSSGRPGLDVITSGPVPTHPVELLQSAPMAQLVASLRTRYDYVIIDSPPLLPVADAAVCAVQADGTVLVVQQGRTTTPQIRAGVERLDGVGARVVGTILVRTQKFTAEHRSRGYGANRGKPAADAPDVQGAVGTNAPAADQALSHTDGAHARPGETQDPSDLALPHSDGAHAKADQAKDEAQDKALDAALKPDAPAATPRQGAPRPAKNKKRPSPASRPRPATGPNVADARGQ